MADGKPMGKASNTVIAESLQQINHEGAVLADLTDEKATEKVWINFFLLLEKKKCMLYIYKNC